MSVQTTFKHLHCNNSVAVTTSKSMCLSLHHYSKCTFTKHFSKLQAAMTVSKNSRSHNKKVSKSRSEFQNFKKLFTLK